MPYIQVYVHFVWCTKNRYPFLDTPELRLLVWQHIRENAMEKGIFVDHVSGFDDHCHCLVALNPDQSLQKTAQMLKGESSWWINKNNLTKKKFEWQDAYYVASVSYRMIDIVRKYIRNQEARHGKKLSQKFLK